MNCARDACRSFWEFSHVGFGRKIGECVGTHMNASGWASSKWEWTFRYTKYIELNNLFWYYLSMYVSVLERRWGKKTISRPYGFRKQIILRGFLMLESFLWRLYQTRMGMLELYASLNVLHIIILMICFLYFEKSWIFEYVSWT